MSIGFSKGVRMSCPVCGASVIYYPGDATTAMPIHQHQIS